jgi:hypothetical protein
MVTAAGAQAGKSTESLLDQVLSLSGLRADGTTLSMVPPPPRDPFRSSELLERARDEQERV